MIAIDIHKNADKELSQLQENVWMEFEMASRQLVPNKGKRSNFKATNLF